MANQFYQHGIELFLEGGTDALTDALKLSLVTTGYTPNFATDQYYSVISGGNITAAGVALTSRTGSAGTLSAANVVWTSVSGSSSSYLILYVDSGTSSTSPLIGLIDTATGLPVTPNGGDITVAWASGQVFTLFQGLPEAEKKLAHRLRDWLRDIAGIPAKLGPGGLYIPEPRIVCG